LFGNFRPIGNGHKTLIDLNLQSKKIFMKSGLMSSQWPPQEDEEYLSLIGSFLGRKENLRSLGIEINIEGQRNILFQYLVVSMQDVTNIEHLSLLLDFEYLSEIVRMDSVNTFIQMNKNSLKSMELKHYFFPDEIFETLIFDLKLKKLILEVFEYSISAGLNSLYNHMKTLIVKQPLHDNGLLFKAFPSIEYLSLEVRDAEINENLVNISKSLKSVKYLKLPLIPDDAPQVQIPSLRVFSTGVYGYYPYSKYPPQALKSTLNFLNSNQSIEF
jgi:hypothetical protein